MHNEYEREADIKAYNELIARNQWGKRSNKLISKAVRSGWGGVVGFDEIEEEVMDRVKADTATELVVALINGGYVRG